MNVVVCIKQVPVTSQVKIDPVTKYMAINLITFTPETEIIEVIDTLLDKRISGAPVLNEKKEALEQECKFYRPPW